VCVQVVLYGVNHVVGIVVEFHAVGSDHAVLRHAAQQGALHYASKGVHEQAMADLQPRRAILFIA
jgi:hypothetical protein